MTDQDLERRLRAWYRADVGDVESAPPQLRIDLASLGQQAADPPRLSTNGWGLPQMLRSAPLAIAATALVAAILIGLALFVRQPPDTGPTQSRGPTSSATTEPSATPTDSVPLGGGLMLVYQQHESPGPCSTSLSPFDVFTVDPGTGARTLLGAVGTECRPRGLGFQWAPDRIHVLMTDEIGQQTLALDAPTAAGRELTFICCQLPTDVWQAGSQTGDGWVLSPAGDRVAAIHTSGIQYPEQEGPTGIADGIVVANIDGSGQETLLVPAGADIVGAGLTWSPDQSAIVVSTCLPCNHARPGESPTAVQREHVFVIPLDGSAVRDVLSTSTGAVGGATWSPDALRFAAVRTECQAGEAFPYCDTQRQTSVLELVSAADGSEQILVSGDQAGGPFVQITGPMWSRDGARIAFWTWSDTGGPDVFGGANTFVVDVDGTNLTSLGAGQLIGWSPDGEWLLVARAAQDETFADLWIVRPDGTGAESVGTAMGAAW